MLITPNTSVKINETDAPIAKTIDEKTNKISAKKSGYSEKNFESILPICSIVKLLTAPFIKESSVLLEAFARTDNPMVYSKIIFHPTKKPIISPIKK